METLVKVSADTFKNSSCSYRFPIDHSKDKTYGIPHIQFEFKWLGGKLDSCLVTIPRDKPNLIYEINCGGDHIMFEGTGEYTTHIGWCKEHRRQYIRWPVRGKAVLVSNMSTFIIGEEKCQY